jgi:hypothetical protein
MSKVIDITLKYNRYGRCVRSRLYTRAVRGVLLILCSAVLTSAQSVPLTSSAEKPPCQPDSQSRSGSDSSEPPSGGTGAHLEPAQSNGQQKPSTGASESCDDANGQQTKRIFWVIPNYRAVNADTHLPAQTVKQKFWLATQDSFDYSAFILAGLLAGYSEATRASPEFDDGAAAAGRYYWHSFADEAVGNYFTEAIVPFITHEDPRYYTLGRIHGGFFRRAGYAVSRLVITMSDSGGTTFNFSEIVGNGLGAGVSDLYYPSQERTLGQTGAKWATQIGIDGIANLLKEFWPDIRMKVSHKPQPEATNP